MNALKIIGILLIVFGLVDFIGPHLDFHLWSKVGIQLPELIWKYSPYIAIASGYGLFKLGSSAGSEEE